MTSTSPAQAFFFSDSSSATKKDVPKPIDNPLLARDPNRSYAANCKSTHESPSPVNSIVPTSPNNFGLRNRKKEAKPGFSLPPKRSYSLGAGVDSIRIEEPTSQYQPGASTKTASPAASTLELKIATDTVRPRLCPSTSGCWVLVYGFSTAEQRKALVVRFRTFGHILDSRSDNRSNWIAFQYQSPLEVEKARCHQHMALTLKDGNTIYCGVKRLSDNDPVLVPVGGPFLSGLWSSATDASPSLVSETMTREDSGAIVAFESKAIADEPKSVPGDDGKSRLEEEDILLASSKDRRASTSGRTQHTTCEKFLRWLFLAHDDDEDNL